MIKPSIILTAGLLTVACGSNPMFMMPAPILYESEHIDPFAHVDDSHREVTNPVHYVTNRNSRDNDGEVIYGNRISQQLSFGDATVQLGPPTLNWDTLVNYTRSRERDQDLLMTVIHREEAGKLDLNEPVPERLDQLPPGAREFISDINADLDRAVDRDILIYVHGTKVDFDNAVIVASELDHFAGRDFVGVAFAWPSHQNILSYAAGTDVNRARQSSLALRRTIELLARHSSARRINILSYSAGGRTTSKALSELRQEYSDLSADELRQRFRLGAVVFAAADVEINPFLDRLVNVSETAQQVMITVSDEDNTLEMARQFMGGPVRAGDADAEVLEEAVILAHHLTNTYILDVSRGQELRGFDITGHSYWFRHPWSSSDMILLLRTELPPHRRGLSESEAAGIWFMSTDYPERVADAAELELNGQW